MTGSKKVTHNFDSNLTLTVLNESDRTFEGWITVEGADRHGDNVDPLGFTAEEYMTIIGGIIMGTHTNLPIGRWSKIEIRENPQGKLAWYGWGRIFKGIAKRGLEDYPVWRDYWKYMVDCYKKGNPVGLSIGGDPDYESHAPYTECDDKSCWRTIPKAWWYETSVVMNRSGPSIPANFGSYVDKVNTLAKAFASDPVMYGELKKAHLHVDRNPSEAQKEVGNYKKGHIRLHGLDITIENPKGSIRSGQDRNGEKWSVKMAADYGYIKRTKGVDGDHLDVFVGPDHDSEWVLVLWQLNKDRSFDEHKVLMGFKTHEEAIDTYGACYNDPEWVENRVGDIREFRIEEFKEWMKREGLKKKAPSITEAPNDQGKVGRLAGDVGHIHPPSGMQDDPVDDDRRYTQQKTLPESNSKRLGEVFPSRRRGGVAGPGARGVRHGSGHIDPTKPPVYASAIDGWNAEHPSGVTIIIHNDCEIDGDLLYDSLNDIPEAELEKIGFVEASGNYIRVTPRYSTVQKQNAHVHAETLEGLIVSSLMKRHGDFSPTNSEIEGHTSLVVHGQREYPEEEGDNFVGSKDGLSVSPIKKGGSMDEDVLTAALRKAFTSIRDADATPGHVPYPITGDPKWRPGTKIQPNAHGQVSDTVSGGPSIEKDYSKPLKRLTGKEMTPSQHHVNVATGTKNNDSGHWRVHDEEASGPNDDLSFDTVAGEGLHSGIKKNANESSIDHSQTPDPMSSGLEKCGCGGHMKKAGPAGMAEKPGDMPNVESGVEGASDLSKSSLKKSSDEDKGKKHEKDDENTRGRMGPQEGKSQASSGDGSAPSEDKEKPQEGFEAQNGNMGPQAMDGSGPPQDPSGLQTNPAQMGPGQPESQTNMPLPGATPMVGDSIGAMILGEMSPEELDAIALAVLSLKKDGANGPLTTATPGAYQARMGPKDHQ